MLVAESRYQRISYVDLENLSAGIVYKTQGGTWRQLWAGFGVDEMGAALVNVLGGVVNPMLHDTPGGLMVFVLYYPPGDAWVWAHPHGLSGQYFSETDSKGKSWRVFRSTDGEWVGLWAKNGGRAAAVA